MSGWSRWLAYAKAKLDDVVRQGNRELDRAEADLEAEASAKPWLRDEGDAPTLDQVGEKIRHQAEEAERAAHGDDVPDDADVDPNQPALPGLGADEDEPTAGRQPSGHTGFDRAEQEREAAERLSAIRRELGLEEGGKG